MVLKTEHTGMCSDDIMYATQFSRVKAKDKPSTGLKNSNFIKKRWISRSGHIDTLGWELLSCSKLIFNTVLVPISFWN